MKRFLKEHKLKSNVKLKCYECHQLQFISLLSALVNGEYEQLIKLNPKIPQDLDDVDMNSVIKKFHDFLKSNRSLSSRSINALFLSILIDSADSFFNSAIKNDEKGRLFVKHSFNFEGMPIFSMLGYSLSQFIMNEDIKKLLHCENCNQFDVSKTKHKRRFCSNKCKSDWHNKKRIQSGEHREYKRRKRREGAKKSYYG